MKNILLTGGTGLIGSFLAQKLKSLGHKVFILTREPKKVNSFPAFYWDIKKGVIQQGVFNKVQIIIHLAGANISEHRWTTKYKKEIYDSRVRGSALIAEALSKNRHSVEQFISASAIGYYGTYNSNNVFTEKDPPGKDFLARVVIDWEAEVLKIARLGIKTTILRTGVVLSPYGGIIKKLYPFGKYYLLAVPGNGRQIIPWIHIADLAGIYQFVMDNQIEGIFNAVSPEVTTFSRFIDVFLANLGRKRILPNIPSFLLKLIFGEQASLLLYGSAVSPQKIIDKGYQFQFPDIQQALYDIVINLKRK